MKRATLRVKTARFEAKLNEIEAKIDQLRARTEKIEARIEDEFRFIRSWLEHPRITGAVRPSGRLLARAMARLVDPALDGPVIELGPGTGVVTQALVDRGVAPQRLVLVEFNRDFIPLLAARFPGARVLRGDAYAVHALLAGKLEAPAASIVSSLPLANQPMERRIALLEDCLKLIRPEGSFVQFSYMLNPPIPVRVADCRLKGTPRIWWNLPPARVWCYRPKPQHIAELRLRRAS